MNIKLLGIFSILSLLTIFACDNSSIVGEELFDEDGIEVRFTDTITLEAMSVAGSDSLETRTSSLNLSVLFTGHLDDVSFGSSQAIPYFGPVLNSAYPDFYMEDTDSHATIDSIVLYVAIDSLRSYGDFTERHHITPYQTAEKIDLEKNYYKFDELELDQAIGDEVSILPKNVDFSLSFDMDTFTIPPALRIPLHNSIIQNVISDTVLLENDTLFRDYIKSFALYDDVENSVLGLDFATAYSLNSPINKMAIYYTDTIAKVYLCPLIGARHQTVIRDHSSTPVETALNSNNPPDDLYYIQGFEEVNVKVNIPYADSTHWSDVLIKKVELEMTVATNSTNTFSPISNLILEKNSEDGERVFIDDLQRVISNNLNIERVFGGYVKTTILDDGTELQQYKINLTSYFNSLIVENNEQDKEMYITPGIPLRAIGRSIIYGPNHETYPMKLNVLYSLPN